MLIPVVAVAMLFECRSTAAVVLCRIPVVQLSISEASMSASAVIEIPVLNVLTVLPSS